MKTTAFSDLEEELFGTAGSPERTAYESHVQQAAVIERPILFSGAMVRALLAGTKTQTRRIMAEQPDFPSQKPVSALRPVGAGIIAGLLDEERGYGLYYWEPSGTSSPFDTPVFNQRRAAQKEIDNRAFIRCPYGKVGDRLWVRETFSANTDNTYDYRADYQFTAPQGGWKPSIFMPRAASRILLEIVSVRVERLQAISEADARAEGVEVPVDTILKEAGKLRFKALWQSINGPDSWQTNPWVWVVEFKRIEP